MTDRHTSAGPQPGLIILQCPTCGTPEPVAAGAIADRRIHMIVCRNCGETWPARAPVGSAAAAAAADRPSAPVLEAVQRPLVAYSGGRSDPWSAMLAADSRTVRAPQRHGLAALAAAAVMLLAAFVALRTAAVAAVPDLAGLYAALGLPVNLDGLAFEDVAARRAAPATAEAAPLTVAGTIRNVGGAPRDVPPLTVTLADESGRFLRRQIVAPPVEAVPEGGSAGFQFTIEAAPAQTHEVVLRFARDGRQNAAGSSGGTR